MMDIGPIEPARAVDKALAAWIAAIESRESGVPVDTDAAHGMTSRVVEGASVPSLPGSGLVERVLGELNPAVPVSEPALPGMDHDAGHESATVQMFSRPQSPANEPLRGADSMLPTAHHAKSEFALPASLLVPALLVGLQIESTTAWPLLRRGAPERWRSSDGAGSDPVAPADDGNEHQDDDPPVPQPAAEDPGRHGIAEELVFDEGDDGAWCEALSRALREAIAARIVPQALLAATEQWRRGRCVVLACPQGADPAGAAWAFVLWPRQANDRAAPANALALFGLRVAARLQWHALPPTTPWCHVRVVKEHHPRRGRQLVSPDSPMGAAASTEGVACEVQLGPVLARSLRWCEVRVHIQAAQRFWAALGQQWSVRVVVCARPLVSARAPTQDAAP